MGAQTITEVIVIEWDESGRWRSAWMDARVYRENLNRWIGQRGMTWTVDRSTSDSAGPTITVDVAAEHCGST